TQFSPRCAREPVERLSHFCYSCCRRTDLAEARPYGVGGFVIVRAPASTANLGPGFDCAAAALDLWNELHVEEGPHDVVVEGEGAGDLPTGDGHLALRAFSLVAPVERFRFRFVNRIP